jgi:hypothetical protein
MAKKKEQRKKMNSYYVGRAKLAYAHNEAKAARDRHKLWNEKWVKARKGFAKLGRSFVAARSRFNAHQGKIIHKRLHKYFNRHKKTGHI